VSPRRWSDGVVDASRLPCVAGVAIAATLAFSACSSAGSVESTTTPNTPAATSTSGELPSTSMASPSTSATSTSVAATTTAPATTTLPPVDDVIAAWSEYWAAWAEVRASADLDPGPLAAVAAPGVVDGAVALFERQRSSGSGAVETEVALHASVVEIGADRA
jgi:hypothetical protein